MSINNLDATRIRLQDLTDASLKNLYVSGGVLYFNNSGIAPLLQTQLNTNDIMLLNINLTSGAKTQKFYYPYGYNPPSTPKIVYSIVGMNGDIIPSTLREITNQYFTLEFTKQIPDNFHYLQAFVFKKDQWLSLSGNSYDLNPIWVNDSLFLDSYYGFDGGFRSGIRNNPNYPYRNFSYLHQNAVNGDNVYIHHGEYGASEINKSLSIKSFPNAQFLSGKFNINNTSVSFYDLNINTNVNAPIGLTNSTVNLYGNNIVNTTSTYSITGNGNLYIYGELHANKPLDINPIFIKHDLEKTGLFVEPNHPLISNNRFLTYSGDNGVARVYKNIQKAFEDNFSHQIFLSENDIFTTNNLWINKSSVDIYNLKINNTSNPSLTISGGMVNLYGECYLNTSSVCSLSGAGNLTVYGNLKLDKPSKINFTKKVKHLNQSGMLISNDVNIFDDSYYTLNDDSKSLRVYKNPQLCIQDNFSSKVYIQNNISGLTINSNKSVVQSDLITCPTLNISSNCSIGNLSGNNLNLSNNPTVNIEKDCIFSSINGTGRLVCVEDIHYSNTPNTGLEFIVPLEDDNQRQKNFFVNPNLSFKGNLRNINNNVFTASISEAINHCVSGETIYIKDSHGQFTVNKPNLKLYFDKDSLVSGSIIQNGTNISAWYHDVKIDPKQNFNIIYGLSVASGCTAYLLGDSSIRIPLRYYTGVSGDITGKQDITWSVSGLGSVFIGSSVIYNQPIASGVTVLTDTNGLKSGFKFFEPTGWLLN